MQRGHGEHQNLRRVAVAVLLVVLSACGAAGADADSADGPYQPSAAATPMTAPTEVAAPTTVAEPPPPTVPVTAAPTTSAPAPPSTAPPPAPTIAPTTAPPAVASSVVEPAVVTRTALPSSPETVAEQRSATISGFARSWTVVAPAGDGTPRPLVIVLHGRGNTGATMRGLGLDELVKSGVVVGYPDALGGSWNDGRANVDAMANQQKVDDIGFVEAIITDAVGHDRVDPGKIALVGHSNGAMLAARIGCTRAAPVAALVLVSGVGGAELPALCAPVKGFSVLESHGLRDPMVPYHGGTVGSVDGRSRGSVAPVPTMLDLWRAKDGCSGLASRVLPGTQPAVTELSSTGCSGSNEIVHFTWDDPTHGWPTFTGWDATTAAKKFLVRHLTKG